MIKVEAFLYGDIIITISSLQDRRLLHQLTFQTYFCKEDHRTNMYIRLSKLVLFVLTTNFNGGTQFLIEIFVD